MAQTVKGSWVEATANVAVGFGVNYCANLVVLPMFGFASLSAGKNLVIGVVYTAISMVRSFVLRRVFTRIKRYET